VASDVSTTENPVAYRVGLDIGDALSGTALGVSEGAFIELLTVNETAQLLKHAANLRWPKGKCPPKREEET
jgi:hypothetical protein